MILQGSLMADSAIYLFQPGCKAARVIERFYILKGAYIDIPQNILRQKRIFNILAGITVLLPVGGCVQFGKGVAVVLFCLL